MSHTQRVTCKSKVYTGETRACETCVFRVRDKKRPRRAITSMLMKEKEEKKEEKENTVKAYLLDSHRTIALQFTCCRVCSVISYFLRAQSSMQLHLFLFFVRFLHLFSPSLRNPTFASFSIAITFTCLASSSCVFIWRPLYFARLTLLHRALVYKFTFIVFRVGRRGRGKIFRVLHKIPISTPTVQGLSFKVERCKSTERKRHRDVE